MIYYFVYYNVTSAYVRVKNDAIGLKAYACSISLVMFHGLARPW